MTIRYLRLPKARLLLLCILKSEAFAPMYPQFVMQSYPARALDRRLQVDWARDPREGPRVLMSLRVDFEPMG